MSSPREIELKLDVPVHDLPFLTASSLLKGTNKSAAKPVSLVSVYFDTDRLKLREKGLSLRVRSIGRHHAPTVKQENNGNAALFARGECGMPEPGSAYAFVQYPSRCTFPIEPR